MSIEHLLGQKKFAQECHMAKVTGLREKLEAMSLDNLLHKAGCVAILAKSHDREIGNNLVRK